MYTLCGHETNKQSIKHTPEEEKKQKKKHHDAFPKAKSRASVVQFFIQVTKQTTERGKLNQLLVYSQAKLKPKSSRGETESKRRWGQDQKRLSRSEVGDIFNLLFKRCSTCSQLRLGWNCSSRLKTKVWKRKFEEAIRKFLIFSTPEEATNKQRLHVHDLINKRRHARLYLMMYKWPRHLRWLKVLIYKFQPPCRASNPGNPAGLGPVPQED